MISTRLYELAHVYRSKGQINDALPLSWSDFQQLASELTRMNCSRALQALAQPVPSYCGLALSIEMD